ncbi:MAG: hypothetical protein OEZ04_12545 [Nitrospinota bacterium]|nr:hypothetical protein [Nitrospinota bacterium]
MKKEVQGKLSVLEGAKEEIIGDLARENDKGHNIRRITPSCSGEGPKLASESRYAQNVGNLK